MVARDFLLPDLGEGLEEAEIVAWNVSVADHVELNQDICEVETAKAVVAVPCPFSGTVLERFGDVGDTLEVGAPLIRVDTAAPGEASSATAREHVTIESAEAPDVLVGYGEGVVPSRRPPRSRGEVVKPLAKPPVRKLAKNLGVDLVSLAPGSGPGGIITGADVREAAGVAPSAGELASSLPLAGVRKRVAEKTARSRAEIPEATCGLWVDCTALWDVRERLTAAAAAEGEQVALTPFALLLRATVLALRRFPILNARLDTEAGEIRLLEEIHLGIATDAPQGLVVPVIRNAERRSTLDLASELQRLVDAARRGSIGQEELAGSTFTVTNYGALGLDDGNPVINHPEAAILGVGAMKQRPWVVEGELAVRRVAKLVCVFDHRIMDGAEAGGFLGYLGGLVEDPARMLLRA
ncbi:MAG: 2-oxo acid dehydrogenase subunit E2 [Actinomycetota bacterium]|nr:2-oxo acid dehydrogenase subunit E2 [Actinomycetota bacterium]